jgi:plasmid stabilization system protein ParE
MSYEFSPEAEDDLIEIAGYIADDNPTAARRLVAEIHKACETLAKHQTLGHSRKDLISDPEIRFYCVRDYYLVVYRKGTSPLQIARVLHGARDIESELGADWGGA